VVRNGHHVPRKAYNIRLFDEELVEPKDESWKKAWRITEALIVAMNEEVLRARARFVLVTLTIPIQVDPMSRKKKRPSGRWARATCSIQSAVCASSESGSAFPSLRLLKSYKLAAVQWHVYFHGFANTAFGTGHFNERGHEIVADILTRELAPFLRESHHGKSPDAGELLPQLNFPWSPSGSPRLKQ